MSPSFPCLWFNNPPHKPRCQGNMIRKAKITFSWHLGNHQNLMVTTLHAIYYAIRPERALRRTIRVDVRKPSIRDGDKARKRCPWFSKMMGNAWKNHGQCFPFLSAMFLETMGNIFHFHRQCFQQRWTKFRVPSKVFPFIATFANGHQKQDSSISNWNIS